MRPTTARVREALFNILHSEFGDFGQMSFLDMFAGSGAIALQACDEGFRFVCAVERDTLRSHQLKEKFLAKSLPGKVVKADCLKLLSRGSYFLEQKFNLIFADPPYEFSDLDCLLKIVEVLLAERGLFVLETHKKTVLKKASANSLNLDSKRKYGDTVLSFWR